MLSVAPQPPGGRPPHRVGPFAARLALAVLACAMRAPVSDGQTPDDDSGRRVTIFESPDLGPIRGSLETATAPPGAFSASPQTLVPAGIIGGRHGNGRIPRPGARSTRMVGLERSLTLPEALPAPTSAPDGDVASTGFDATLFDDEGPADGVTLDAAIERMMQDNPDLRALRHELSQADADILTAGLRANPLIYMDSQFIPYGSFNDRRPGGPPQYDVNITYPLDVSGKRRHRTVVARMARSTIEAQFQDATRRQIDNVHRAFVSLQVARLDLVAARRDAEHRHVTLARFVRSAAAARPDAADETDRRTLDAERADAAAADAAAALADAQEGLAVLLAIPSAEVDALLPRGTLRDPYPQPPEAEALSTLALRCRPDLRAARLGVERAEAEVGLQHANRFDDIYLFYDPLTIQDNSVYRQQTATSWAVGLTFSLPVFNRNQGNIARARSNVGQSRLELESLERRVAAEVRLAEREYRRSREAVEIIERDQVPRTRAAVERARAALAAGAITDAEYQERVDAASAVTASLRDALVRHRRAMGELNTALGLRLLP